MENMQIIWDRIKEYAVTGGMEATRVMLELYYVVRSPATPTMDKALIIAALAYQLLPGDLLSMKRFGILGLFDNAVTIGYAYRKFKYRVTPEIEAEVEQTLSQWFGPKTVSAEEV